MRCQLQIYTPPLAHCTSLKPEAACSGFISVPAHTGYIGPHALIYLSCLSERLFPPRERWGADEIYACIWDEIHFGKSTWTFSDRKEPFSLPSPFSPPPCLPPCALPPLPEWESVMDVHVHAVSKNTSVTPALSPSVLCFSMIALLVLSITYNVLLIRCLFFFFFTISSMLTCFWVGMSRSYSKANVTANERH